ncbi:uncharacterized protein LOC126789247 [Argentina anserina]|uniref:uncharacterized protein LOC126789247 n=1 Tax=Argentina anserina TaxID=57926 RepID=UPI0021768CED|nr:uncharacterized protein LOC126789247 [Potentilla anserina]
MAASNIIFNLSRSPLPQYPAVSHSRSPSLKPSGVCFTSASVFSKGRAADRSVDYSSCRPVYAGKDWSTKAKATKEDDVEDEKQLFEQITGAATEYAEETMENVKGAAEAISGTAKDYADDAKEKTNEATETIAAKAEVTTNKVAEPETTESDSEKVKETTESDSEKVKETTEDT